MSSYSTTIRQLSTNLSCSGRAQGSTQKLQQQTGEKSPIMTSQKGKGEQFRVAGLIPPPRVGQLGADRKSQRIPFTREKTGRVTSYPTFQGPAGGAALVSSHSETGTARLSHETRTQRLWKPAQSFQSPAPPRPPQALSLRVWTATASTSGPLKLSSLRTSPWTPTDSSAEDTCRSPH